MSGRPQIARIAPAAAPPPLRILHVIWWGEIGGIALNLVDLASHCRARNHVMEVCVLTRSSHLIDALADQDVRVREMHARSGRDLLAFGRVYRLLRRERYDVVQDHTGNLLAASAILLGAHGARTVHQEHGAINNPRLNGRKRWFYRVFGSRFDRFVAVSARAAQDIIQAGADRHRVQTITNPVDPVRFSSHPSRQEAKRTLGLPESTATVGTACRFAPEKDLDLFLEVARQIRLQRPETRFVMVGGGEEAERLRQVASDLGILSSVAFTGMRTDMATVWRAFDVYLFTSRIETFGRTLLEALACETPIVAAVPIAGGAIDVVRDSPGIVSVADRNPERLAAESVRLLDAPVVRDEAGRRGRQWVIEHYHVTKWLEALDDLYRRR
jgi:glycosyltransferase involved in cell wall biosynthesis